MLIPLSWNWVTGFNVLRSAEERRAALVRDANFRFMHSLSTNKRSMDRIAESASEIVKLRIIERGDKKRIGEIIGITGSEKDNPNKGEN